MIAGVAAFLPWAATSEGTTLDSFHYEGLYVGGGLGAIVVLAAIAGALLSVAILAADEDAIKALVVFASLAGIMDLGVAILAASKISSEAQEGYFYSSMSGGSIQTGVWIAALGGVGLVVGALVAALAGKAAGAGR